MRYARCRSQQAPQVHQQHFLSTGRMCRDRDPARQRISCGGCGDARGSTRAVALCADDEAHGADDEAHVETWLTVEVTREISAVMTVCFTLVGTQFFIIYLSSNAAKRQNLWNSSKNVRILSKRSVLDARPVVATWAQVWAMIAPLLRLSGSDRHGYDGDNARYTMGARANTGAPRRDAARARRARNGETLPRRHERQKNAATSSNRQDLLRRAAAARVPSWTGAGAVVPSSWTGARAVMDGARLCEWMMATA